jgi:4-hydroxy-tetrahydrodipicolinate synthase
MIKHILTGTGVALVTPFNNDTSIDFEALDAIVNHVIRGGVEFLVVLGTTSEAATLNQEEKKQVLERVLKTNSSRIPVVLGMGGNNSLKLIDEIKNQDFTGVSAILSVTPYYNKPQQAGLLAHFNMVADVSPVPVILYNVPGRTSVNMKADTTLKLAVHPNIVSVKEASGDMAQVMAIVAGNIKDFEVLSGDDALTLPMLAVGAKGVISVVANAFPEQFSRMVRAGMNNCNQEAKELHYRLLHMIDLLFADGNPAGIKTALNCLGLCSNTLRMPLVGVQSTIAEEIAKEVSRIN